MRRCDGTGLERAEIREVCVGQCEVELYVAVNSSLYIGVEGVLSHMMHDSLVVDCSGVLGRPSPGLEPRNPNRVCRNGEPWVYKY